MNWVAPDSPRFYFPVISQRNFFPSQHQVVLYHCEPQCHVTHIYMITGPGNTREHMGPSHLPVPLSPCSWGLCFARRVPWRAHSSFLLLKEPFLGCFFYKRGRRDEFHFMSGLRGEESLSCLAQGWDASNKGGLAAVKNPVLVEGGCSPSSHMLCENMGAPVAYHNTAVHTWLCSLPLCMPCALCTSITAASVPHKRGSLRSRGRLLVGSPPSCTVIAELCFMML